MVPPAAKWLPLTSAGLATDIPGDERRVRNEPRNSSKWAKNVGSGGYRRDGGLPKGFGQGKKRLLRGKRRITTSARIGRKFALGHEFGKRTHKSWPLLSCAPTGI